MEENRNNYRAINIATAVAGVILCVGAFFIPAPDGLLADGSSDLFHAIMNEDLLTMFAAPTLMILLSALIVMIGKGRSGWIAVIAAIGGGAIFAWMDIGFARANMSCCGTLVNGIGIVLAITAALLQAFATPSSRYLRKEQRLEAEEEKSERSREARVFFDDTPEDHSAYADADEGGDAGIDINALRYEALRIESKDAGIKDAAAGSPESSAAASETDLEALLRSEIENEAAHREPEKKEIDLSACRLGSEEPGEIVDEAPKDTTAFYGGLEDMFLDE